MQITPETLNGLFAAIRTNFDLAYQAAIPQGQWPLIATQIPVTTPVVNYGFLGRGLVIEKLRDRPREQGVSPYRYLVADEVYEGVLTVERTALEDDNLGLIRTRINAIGQEPVRAWDKLVFEGLPGGYTALCYDDQYFFDTDHPDPHTGGTWSNLSTSPFSAASLAAMDEAMRLRTDDKGEPMGIVPDTLVVGPKLYQEAWEVTQSPVTVVAVGSGTAGTGATAATPYANYHKGRYNLLVSDRIRDEDYYLLDTKRDVKPLFIQSRSDIGWDIGTDALDFGARFRGEFNFGIRGRYGLGYGLPQTAYAGNPS